MVKIGRRITELRKKKGWSQTELAKQVSASREAIGKYERDEAQPSVETAKKIADAFDVTLDYLVDEEAIPTFDKITVNRIKSIQQLDEENKSHVFAMLDAFLLKCSIQNNLATPK
jgi:transcriptional regulator with XRE-family HTH domain